MKPPILSNTQLTLLLSLAFFSSTVSAHHTKATPAASGVAVDISLIDLRSDAEREAEAQAQLAALEAAALKKAADETKRAEAAKAAEARKQKNKELLDSMVASVKPEAEIPPLENDRFSAYFSEKVVAAIREGKTERFGLTDARTHVGILVSEERDTVLQGGLALDTPFLKTMRLSFGARAYGALLSRENTDIFAAAIGVETAYKLPSKKLPLEFSASLYYAPDILTFGGGERSSDTRINVTLPVRNELAVFGGIRHLEFDTRPGDPEIDNRPHIGLRWDFK